MENETKLVCTGCDKEIPFSLEMNRCNVCGEPLEVNHIKNGKININAMYRSSFIERYKDFYPYINSDRVVSLGEGNTGLVSCEILADELGFEKGTLFIKNETQNPTWSFKDRGTFVGANLAKEKGYKLLGVVSSGNNAASCAAYAAALGMKSIVFVAGHILDEKILPIAVYGATVIKVKGDYGKLYYDSIELAKKYNIYFANSDVHTRIEGAKSIAFEICEQFEFNPPEWVIVPTGSGGTLRGIEKGFYEFKSAGLITNIPKIVAAQPEGACPIYQAWLRKDIHIKHFGELFTIAHGLANPYPPSGNQTLRLIKEGRIARPGMVLEKDILTYQRLTSKSGIFGQPESYLSIGVASEFLKKGIIKKGERVTCLVTGSGLKATSLLAKSNNYSIFSEKLENLDQLVRNIV